MTIADKTVLVTGANRGIGQALVGFYESLDRLNRYAIFYRIQDSKRPETRARRIARFVDMLERSEKLHD